MLSTVVIGLLTMLVWELLRRGVVAALVERAPLSGYYWQPVYNPLDPSLATLWSLEIVEVRQRGRRLSGRMYRVYGGHWQRSWEFTAWISKNDAINLNYHSTGKDDGQDGTIRLRPLQAQTWSGAMRAAPDTLRELARAAGLSEGATIRQVGADFSEDAAIEWIRADGEGDDPARRWIECWLSTAPGERAGESAVETLKRTLPSRIFRVLTNRPPYPPWWVTGLAAAATVNAQTPELMAAIEHARRQAEVEQPTGATRWQSPTASILKLRGGQDQDAQEGGGR